MFGGNRRVFKSILRKGHSKEVILSLKSKELSGGRRPIEGGGI